MKSHPKPRNWTFFDKFNYFTPGVAGMFILLGFLLIGAVLGNLVTLLCTALLGPDGMEYGLLLSYPLMFLPAMVYASHKSSSLSMNHDGVKLNSANFSPLGAVVCALAAAVLTVSAAFCIEPLTTLLPEMPRWLRDTLEGMTSGTLWVDFLCVSIFAPLFEEWLCRGMVMRGLLANGMKPVWAILISALFFALIHANPWQALPALALGLVFGYVYYKTGSLTLTMLMHFTNNTLALVLGHIEAFKDAETWMDVIPTSAYGFVYAAMAVLTVVIILAFRKIELKDRKGNFDSVKSIFD